MLLVKGKKMKIEEAIFGRRSIRKYSNDLVPDEIIRSIIKAGMYAPSACNFQAWKIIIIDNEIIKSRLVEIGATKIINRSKQGLLVVYRNDLKVRGYTHRDYIQSAAAAIENMLLMAFSLGVSTCWLCDLPSSDVFRKVLDIPDNFDVIAYITIGYPVDGSGSNEQEMNYHYGNEKDFVAHKRKYSLDQVICHNKFSIIDDDVTHFTFRKSSNNPSTRIKVKPYKRIKMKLYKLYQTILEKQDRA